MAKRLTRKGQLVDIPKPKDGQARVLAPQGSLENLDRDLLKSLGVGNKPEPPRKLRVE